MQDDDEIRARRARRRLALILLAIALGFYIGFIVLAYYRSPMGAH